MIPSKTPPMLFSSSASHRPGFTWTDRTVHPESCWRSSRSSSTMETTQWRHMPFSTMGQREQSCFSQSCSSSSLPVPQSYFIYRLSDNLTQNLKGRLFPSRFQQSPNPCRGSLSPMPLLRLVWVLQNITTQWLRFNELIVIWEIFLFPLLTESNHYSSLVLTCRTS